jgi:hypothetical protein
VYAAVTVKDEKSTYNKQLSGTAREEAVLRSSTDFVREARKNLSQAAGKKYVEIQSQKSVASN